jgi:hypothetical protein
MKMPGSQLPACISVESDGIGLIAWAHINVVLIECTSIYAAHGPYYLNQKMVLSVSIISVIYRNRTE